MKPLRVGVIGVGSMGLNHARLYSQMPGVELVGVADVDQGLAASAGRTYSCQPYTDYRALLSEQLDAVSIAVPTTLHEEVALSATERGISILVEKPIADTVESADRMLLAARRKGVKLMVGYIERFNPAIIRLKELIDSGHLGDIISISAKRVGPYSPRIRDVGIILDLGTHDIDIMSYLYGEKINTVFASAGSVVHSHEDHAIIVMNFGNGRSGVIETNWLTPHKVRSLTVTGSSGIAEVDYLAMTLKVYDREWVREAKIEKEEPLKLELQHYVECVRQNQEPAVSGEDGRHALKVALAAEQSYLTGQLCRIK